MFDALDGYCERVGPEYWAEPLNALTNLAFLLAALIAARRAWGQTLPVLLAAMLAAIGVGSWLFHTHAQVWAAAADVIPIAVFVLTYLYAANRHYWHLPVLPAIVATALFVPYAALTVPVFALLPGLGSSAGYAPVPLLILIYAVLLRHRLPRVAAGLGLGAAILIVSLAARTVDGPLCSVWPAGTHFIWHLMNAAMLGWMLEVLRRHLAQRAAGGQDGP